MLESTRILCVDDDLDTLEVVSRLFSDYYIRTARSASQALELATNELFNLYFLDNWMPECDGIQLCKSLRRFDPNTPIIFYSGAAYQVDRQLALEAGADKYLVKPTGWDSLKESATELIEEARLKDLRARSVALQALSKSSRDKAEKLTDKLQSLLKKSHALTLNFHEEEARLKAFRTYIQAGGTRAGFEKFWSEYQDSLRIS